MWPGSRGMGMAMGLASMTEIAIEGPTRWVRDSEGQNKPRGYRKQVKGTDGRNILEEDQQA